MRVERIECGIDAGFAHQSLHQGQQALGQHGGEVAPVALASQHVAGAGERARIVVAARAQQAGGPEFDLGRVDQQAWLRAHARSLAVPAPARSSCRPHELASAPGFAPQHDGKPARDHAGDAAGPDRESRRR